MRVTHVITRLIVGGAQENTIATVLGLQAYPDLQVDLLSGPTLGPEGSLHTTFARKPSLLKIIPDLVRPVRPFQDWRALENLTKNFQETKPDIVHTHSGKAGILGRIAAKRANVPIIVHTIHGPSFGAFQGRLANLVFRSAEKYAARFTTHFISVADAMTAQYLNAGIGSPEKYTRIFSGFPLAPFLSGTNDFKLREELGIRPDDFVIGKIARLFELKGHDDLLEVAPELVRKFPRVKFLLIGDGPWRQRLESRAESFGVRQNFVFTGLIPPDQIPRFLGIMNALVHLSRREGLPRALSQALAAGKPVVAYDCDGAKEVCLPDETGFLIPVGDKKMLLEKFGCLISDPALCQRMGATGRALVEKKFSIEQMVENIYALYKKLEAQREKSNARAAL